MKDTHFTQFYIFIIIDIFLIQNSFKILLKSSKTPNIKLVNTQKYCLLIVNSIKVKHLIKNRIINISMQINQKTQ